MNKVIIVFLGLLLLVSFAAAEDDCTFEYSNTQEFLSSMNEINSKLSSCELMIPESFNFALKNKNVFISIDMNSEETEQFYISIVEGRISSLNTDVLERYSYYVMLNEGTMDSILQSDNKIDSFLTNIDNGNIVVDPRGLIATMTWFLANLFF